MSDWFFWIALAVFIGWWFLIFELDIRATAHRDRDDAA